MIKEAGGISVLAHPWCCKDHMSLILKLADAGLHGLKVYNDCSKVDMYAALAKESGLIMTGGSDFHGIDKTERYPGDMLFSNNACTKFLEFAKSIRKEPLLNKIQNMIDSTDVVAPMIRIWKEQYEAVRSFISNQPVEFQVEDQYPYVQLTL